MAMSVIVIFIHFSAENRLFGAKVQNVKVQIN